MALDDYVGKVVDKIQLKMDMLGASPLKEFILKSNSAQFGRCVLRGMQVPEELALAATSICRRAFEWFDIVLMIVLDEEEAGESGIVFTDKGIYHWLEGEKFVAEVLYEDIDAIGYVEEYVIITTADDSNVELFCGKDAVKKNYTRYLYNFIVDICKFLEREGREGHAD